MSEIATGSPGSSAEALLRVVVALQIAIVIGLVVVFLQFDGIPQRVADLVPQTGDNSGQIFDLQSSVDALSDKVDALQATLETRVSPAP